MHETKKGEHCSLLPKKYLFLPDDEFVDELV